MSDPSTSGSVSAFASILRPVNLGTQTGRSKRAKLVDTAVTQATKQGYEAGYEEGFECGRGEGLQIAYRDSMARYSAEIQRFVMELQMTRDRAQSALEAHALGAERELAELALAIAVKIIGKEVSTSPEAAASLVRTVISEVAAAAEARIRVHPSDAEAVQPFLESIILAGSQLRGVELVRDSSIVGGCMVETDGGVYDGRIDSLMQEALANFREAA